MCEFMLRYAKDKGKNQTEESADKSRKYSDFAERNGAYYTTTIPFLKESWCDWNSNLSNRR